MDLQATQAQLQELLLAQSPELEQAAQQAIANFPQSGLGYAYLAQAHLLYWRGPEALQAIEQALQLEADNVQYKKIFALAKRRNYENEAALAAYLEVEQALPQDTEVALAIAELYAETWQEDKALDQLNRLIEQHPQCWPAYQNRARLYANQQYHQEALQDINTVIAVHPQDVSLYEQRVWIYRGMNDLAGVEADLKKIVELQPENVINFHNLGDFYADQGQWPQALSIYNQGIQTAQERGWTAIPLYIARAKVALQLDDLDQAAADAQKAIEAEDYLADAYLILGKIAQEQGQWQAAADAFSKGLEHQQHNQAEWIKNRALCYQQLENWEAAEQDFNEWVQQSFESAESLIALGHFYRQKGDLKAAYEAWANAAQYNDEAQLLIEQYCPAELEAAKQAQAEAENKKVEEVLAAFEGDVANNEASPILQKVFNKHWQIDFDQTLSSQQDALNLLPEMMRNLIFDIFRNITFTITPQRLHIQSPMASNVDACYRIESETETDVQLYAQPLDGREHRNLGLKYDGQFLYLSGLMDQTMSEPEEGQEAKPDNAANIPYLILKEIGPGAEGQGQDNLGQKLQSIASTFMGELIEMFSDKFAKAFSEDNKPDEEDEEAPGEKASDNTDLPPTAQ
jgi:tetratricopeptide (TPR) repeat protein